MEGDKHHDPQTTGLTVASWVREGEVVIENQLRGAGPGAAGEVTARAGQKRVAMWLPTYANSIAYCEGIGVSVGAFGLAERATYD